MNNEEKILELLIDLKTDVAELKTRVTAIEVTQEHIVLPHLDRLAEGHTAIQQQIRDLSVIDRMQDDIFTLKAAVKHLSTELDQLKSAM